MSFKPNRPVRVGTKMTMTDDRGRLPGAKQAADTKAKEPKKAAPKSKKKAASEPANKSAS